MRWLEQTGFFDRTVDRLESPKERFLPNPHLSGVDGGHTINLHRFSREGIHLLGHMRGARGSNLRLEPDLHENLSVADEFARQFKQGIDKFIQEQGLDAPPDDEPELEDDYRAPVISELDLETAGIHTIIWATGCSFDFSWVKFPVFDEFGYPVQERGVTPQPGLYFLSLHWLHTIKSGLLLGVGDDAAHIAEHIESRI